MAVNYENGEKDLFYKIKTEKEQPKKEPLDTFYTTKKKIEMYSNFSIGYVGFRILRLVTPVGYLNDYLNGSHGVSLGYDYGIKPIKNINLYTELGVRVFPKKDEVYTSDASGVGIVLEDAYFTISFPLNLKYKINVTNSNFAISPYIGTYYRCDVGRDLPSLYANIGNQFGWQLGLSVGYKKFSLLGFYGQDFKRKESDICRVLFGFSIGYRFRYVIYRCKMVCLWTYSFR